MAATDSKKWWERFPGVSAAKEQAAGLRKAQNEYVTKRGDATLAEGKAANTLRNKNAPNAYDPIIPKGQRVQHGDIPDVQLANAKPSVRTDPNKVVQSNPRAGENPGNLRNSPQGRDVNPNSINAQRQFDADLEAKRQSGRLPNPEPAVSEVYTVAEGSSPALERGNNRINSATTPDQVIVGGKTYPNRAAYEADRAITEAASLVDKVKRGIPVDASKEAIQKAIEMVKSAGAAVGSGQVAATIGSTLGTQGRSAVEGAMNSVPYASGAPNAPPVPESPEITDLKAQEVSLRDALNNPGLSPAQQSEIAAELTTVQRSLASADIDPNAPDMTEIDGQIKPDPRDADFNKGQATTLGNGTDPDLDAQIAGFDEPNTPPPRSDADINAEIDRLNAVAQNKSYPKSQRNAAAARAAELLGLGTPKAQKNIVQRVGAGLKNALPAVLGGTKAETIDPNTINPETHRPDGSKRQTLREHLKPNGQPFGKFKLAGGAVAAGFIPEIAAGIALSVEEGTFKEDAANMFKQFPDAMADFLKRAVTDPGELAKEIGMDAVDELANLKNNAIAGLGAFNEITSGRGGRMGPSGVTFDTPGQTAFDMAREQLPDNDVFDRRPNSPQNLRSAQNANTAKDAKDVKAQDLIDQSRAGDKGLRSGAARTNYVEPGLRQDRRQITDEQYQVNNFRVNDIQADQEPGTGFMQSQGPDGNFETFIDARHQPERTTTPRGLDAARAEILNRGKFANGNRFSDNVDGNWAAEMAGARMRADENKTAAFNDRTAASLRGANMTANTAANEANEKRYTDLGARLDSTDADIKRNAKTDAFYGFLNEKEQQGGRYNPNSAYARQAGNILRRGITEMSDPNVPKAIWNSLMPAFLGGGGMGALQWLNGNLNMGGQFDSMTVDPDGTIRAMSSDGPVKSINLGLIPDTDTAVFARQVLRNTPEKK